MAKVRIEQGSLLIADLSGYTHYLASVDLETIHVVCELLDTIATALPPFEVVKLEGDVVFCQAFDGSVSGEQSLMLIKGAYEQFLAHASRISNDSGCTCPACNLLPGLGLKFVLHHGEYAVHDIAGRTELVGPDVILAHRLLKNAVGCAVGPTRLRAAHRTVGTRPRRRLRPSRCRTAFRGLRAHWHCELHDPEPDDGRRQCGDARTPRRGRPSESVYLRRNGR